MRIQTEMVKKYIIFHAYSTISCIKLGHNNNHINAPDATKVIGTAIPTSPPVETPPTAGAPQTLLSGISWCGSHSDKLQINTLDIEPWPLVKGQDIVFKSSGKVLEKMNNG